MTLTHTGLMFGKCALRWGLWLLCVVVLVAPAAAQETPGSVDTMLASMTLEQKVGQMFMVSLDSSDTLVASEHDFLQTWKPGAVVLFDRNTGTPDAVTRLTNALQQAVTGAGGPPMLIAVDQEGGIIDHLQTGFTQWPVPMLLTASGDDELAYRVGAAMAQELSAVGVNMDLAPVADLNTNPANPIIGRRSFGTDPATAAPIVAAVIRGMQDGGVIATAKHFPGHGDTSADSHLTLPIVAQDRTRLESVELAPFRASIAAGVGAIMVAHVWYPALQPEEDPASLAPAVVTDLLRGELGFNGLAMTDALDMNAVDATYTPAEAAVMAVQAGQDLIAIGAHVGIETQAAAMQAVVDAVRAGQIDPSQIDDAVRRILSTKAQYGLLDWMPLDPEGASARVGLNDHARLVEEMFHRGVTLVYDRNGTVPLLPDTSLTIVYPATRTVIRRECGTYVPDAHWVGVSEYPTDEEISWAAGAASRSAAVVVFTQNADSNAAQQTLVRALPAEKTVVVALWSPFDALALPDVAAYLATYSPLDPGVPAVCAVLFGAEPARGRLPVALGDAFPAGTGVLSGG